MEAAAASAWHGLGLGLGLGLQSGLGLGSVVRVRVRGRAGPRARVSGGVLCLLVGHHAVVLLGRAARGAPLARPRLTQLALAHAIVPRLERASQSVRM